MPRRKPRRTSRAPAEQASGAIGKVLAKPYQAPFIFAGAVVALVVGGVLTQGWLSAALDARINEKVIAVVDSPERLARRTTMQDKHAEYDRQVADLGSRTVALERNGSDQTLTLAKISVTLEQVQKDVAEIRDEQRSLRPRSH